jgi:hypothetical protein
MSMIMLPLGRLTGRPTPIAAAIGLGDQEDLAGAGVLRRVAHGALLHLGDSRRHADDDARLDEAALLLRLADEFLEHDLGDLKSAMTPSSAAAPL